MSACSQRQLYFASRGARDARVGDWQLGGRSSAPHIQVRVVITVLPGHRRKLELQNVRFLPSDLTSCLASSWVACPAFAFQILGKELYVPEVIEAAWFVPGASLEDTLAMENTGQDYTAVHYSCKFGVS